LKSNIFAEQLNNGEKKIDKTIAVNSLFSITQNNIIY